MSPASGTAAARVPPTRRRGRFGEHQHGSLDNAGRSYDMESCLEYGKSHGGEVCLPFVLGARPSPGHGTPALAYALLWNMPNYGGVDFAGANASEQRWHANSASQTDYWVSVPPGGGAPAGPALMQSYVDATGHAPLLPEYAAGYWCSPIRRCSTALSHPITRHSRNRYASQRDLLAAAEHLHALGIPTDIIVIDYNHWQLMGDWSFDPSAWPDVPGMMDRLAALGVSGTPSSPRDSLGR